MKQLDQNNSDNSYQDDTIDLKDLFALLWNGRYLVILITAVSAIGAYFYSQTLSDYYRSSASLSVAEGNTGSASQNLGGLASLAGINISTVSRKGPMYINTISSRAFLKHLLEVDENILPGLVAAESYDRELKKLVYNSDVYDAVNKKWVGNKPNHLQVYSLYRKLVYVDFHEIRRTMDVNVEHISQVFAYDLLSIIISEADSMLRERDIEISTEAIGFLTDALARTPLLEIKNSINQLILTQLNKQMMAKVSKNYIVNILDPPFIPLRSFKPNRGFIRLVGVVFGLLAGILFILLRYYFTRNTIQQKSEST